MKKWVLFLFTAFLLTDIYGQINAKLMRYMDVSDSQIVFVYGGDIWLAPKEGGTAIQVTHSPGEESWPKFSPDGKFIAYTANYDGNADIFVMPVSGGVPTRITYQSFPDRMVEWTPDGSKLLFASSRESFNGRVNQFYVVSKDGGLPEKLSIPYGELGSYSPDGRYLAYITRITESYPFKRYRGGYASDIIVFDLQNNTAEKITDSKATDGKPAWAGDKIYYISDQNESMRLNVWAYDTKTKEAKQLTDITDFDVSYMSAGPSDLVFEAGGDLYIMDLATEKYKPVAINVVSDLSVEMPRMKDVSSSITGFSAGPEGKRVVFEARGELFNVPAKDGYVINMTKSSGAYDKVSSWSPDGKYIAYWSDMSGEFEIYKQASDGHSVPEKLTDRKRGFGYNLFWSPDGKKIAYIDERNDISVLDIESKKVIVAGNVNVNITNWSRYGYPVGWSPDSKWIAFTEILDNENGAVFVYNVESNELHQVTSGFYEDSEPVFSADGKYLFYQTKRNFSAEYSDLDDTWIYPNSSEIAALSLTKDAPSLLAPKNDSISVKEDKAEKSDDVKEDKEDSGINVDIDFDDIESRLVILPPKAGNFGSLFPFEGKLAYLRRPNTGSSEHSSSLVYYDFDKREEQTIMENVRDAEFTSDGTALMVQSSGSYGIIKPEKGQKIENPIPTDGLVMEWVPREEWTEIFNDTWRRYRDFFYDPDLHHVDWDGLRKRYGSLIKYARTRWDITNLQSNLSAELSAGHTYTRGGDVEQVNSQNQNGYLGIDWELNNNLYRIKRIVKPAAWDTEVRSPFDKPGVDVKEGDYILSVNGVALDPSKDPYAAFEGFDGKTVSLTVSKTGSKADAKEYTVECLSQRQESTLRYLEWIENNRKMVDKLSDGQLGYVYMSNTSSRGQLELVSMYYGQLGKKGFVIDERFNGGGQLADRFMELLQRPVVYNLHWRYGRDLTQPIKTNTGPMGMLINGWAASGGDGLPWAFKVLNGGPIVGERTLGILIGPATGHSLVDGGIITIPGARLYDNKGYWFWEGEGVSPDYEVWDDPNMLVKGRDPQMEKVVEEVMKSLKSKSYEMTPAPPLEDRTAKGQQAKEKSGK